MHEHYRGLVQCIAFPKILLEKAAYTSANSVRVDLLFQTRMMFGHFSLTGSSQYFTGDSLKKGQ